MSKLLGLAIIMFEHAENSYSKMSVDELYVNDCCYHLQQSIEFTLKYVVEMNGLRYAENHDIRANINILNRENITLPMQEQLRSMASTLYSWETSTRYNDDFVALKEDIDEAFECGRLLIEYASQLVHQEKAFEMSDIPQGRL